MKNALFLALILSFNLPQAFGAKLDRDLECNLDIYDMWGDMGSMGSSTAKFIVELYEDDKTKKIVSYMEPKLFSGNHSHVVRATEQGDLVVHTLVRSPKAINVKEETGLANTISIEKIIETLQKKHNFIAGTPNDSDLKNFSGVQIICSVIPSEVKDK